MENATSSLTVAETHKYLSRQQAQGWPGSRSIQSRPRTAEQRAKRRQRHEANLQARAEASRSPRNQG